MLKNGLLKRIFIIISCLFILLILYLFPKKTEPKQITENERKAIESSIYLIDQHNYVSRVSVVTQSNSKIAKVQEIIEYLTIGSKNSSYLKAGFKPIIPQNTKLLAATLDDDLLKLNFSRQIYKITAENEEKMISSIIYSMTSIEGINKVSIYVEDSILNELPHSKKPLPPTLDRSFGINTVYDLTGINATTKTTVYYLSKYEGYYYYVPVTMVNNDPKDKMEIIIKELTSKAIYQTNLISYLKDAKQINYEISDDSILIKLNNELYQDLNDSHLIETVIYAINLAIKDNYEIKTVLYMIEDTVFNTYIL